MNDNLEKKKINLFNEMTELDGIREQRVLNDDELLLNESLFMKIEEIAWRQKSKSFG